MNRGQVTEIPGFPLSRERRNERSAGVDVAMRVDADAVDVRLSVLGSDKVSPSAA
jgi:hypothetical protein